MAHELSVGLWNVQWASRASKRGGFFMERLRELCCDVLCVTEGHADILPQDGHVITSESDYGYPIKVGRRKVLLWSRNPWRNVDTLGSALLPPGRFSTGVTESPSGALRFVGVCIPWREAHVRTGQRNRRPWEDHLTFLQHLPPLLRYHNSVPTLLLGDFNQRIPRAGQPKHVYSALVAAIGADYRLVTGGIIAGAPHCSIDHLAICGPLNAIRIDALSRQGPNGVLVSDHFGLRFVLNSPGNSDDSTSLNLETADRIERAE